VAADRRGVRLRIVHAYQEFGVTMDDLPQAGVLETAHNPCR
jgi:hypothetical protein